MKSLVISTIALLFLFASCENQKEEQSVSGTIANAEGQQITLLGFPKGQPDTLGTKTLTADGSFSFPVAAGNLAFYALNIGDEGSMILAFDSAQSPEIKADLSKIQKEYDVSNSKDSEEIRNLYVKSVAYETQLDSLMKNLQEAAQNQDNEKRDELSTAYNQMRIDYRDYLIGLIENDSTSVANFTILQRLNPDQDFDYFVKARNGMSTKLRGNTFFDQMANQIAQMENQKKAEAAMGTGALAPDIVLPTPEGPDMALSSLRGNYVLIDFWASWCKPCRIENPNVVKMYNKYSNDNFEIFGVSLDRDKKKWVDAIAQDNLTWPQVSDLGFWNSAAAQLYNVTSIPYTVLVDPEGKIIATKLRGRALEEKMASIFGH